MFILHNPHKHPVKVGEVTVNPDQRLDIQHVTPEIEAARERGDITLTDATLTAAERHADVEAFKPFKVGDPAIDGD